MKRAFTLAEMLVTCGLVALMLAMGAAQMQVGGRRVDSGSLARLVAEELNLARQQAGASGLPTAVALPSGHCQGLLVWQGADEARLVRRIRYDRDYPDLSLCSRPWATGAWAWTEERLYQGGADDTFSVLGWPGLPAGPSLVFLPGGSVVGSRWPRSPQGYHLVVGTGLNVGARDLQGVQQACTVTVDPLGGVRVESGVPGLPADAGGPPSPPAALPDPTLPANHDPIVRDADVTVQPAPNLDTLPPGVSATLDLDGYLTFDLLASDTDGDALDCQWECSGGVFADSLPRQRLAFRPELGKWKSSVVWSPPIDAVAGDIFYLKCTVEDGRGGKKVATNSVLGRPLAAAVRSRGHLISNDGSMIYRMEGDATHLDEVPLSIPINQASMDPTGTHLIMEGAGPEAGKLFTANADGTELAQVVGPVNASQPDLSAFGQIVYLRDDGTGHRSLYRCALDGSEELRLTEATDFHDLQPRWSANGSRIVFTRVFDSAPNDPKLRVMDEDGESVGRNQDLGRGWSPCWNGNGATVAFLRADGIYVLHPDDSSPVVRQLLNEPFRFSENHQLNWSNQQHSLVYIRQDGTPAGTGDLRILKIDSGRTFKALSGPLRTATWTW